MHIWRSPWIKVVSLSSGNELYARESVELERAIMETGGKHCSVDVGSIEIYPLRRIIESVPQTLWKGATGRAEIKIDL